MLIEQGADRAQPILSKTVLAVRREGPEDAVGDVTGGAGAMTLAEQRDGVDELPPTETNAAEKQRAWSGLPHCRQGFERVGEPGRGRLVPGLESGGVLVIVDMSTLQQLTIGSTPGLLGAVVVVDVADDGVKVAGPVSDVVAVDLAAESAFGALQDLEREAAEAADESRLGSLDVVGVVEGLEQQAPGAASPPVGPMGKIPVGPPAD